MPRLNGLLETALYVDSLDRAQAFYQSVFGFEPLEIGVGGSDQPPTPDPRFRPLQIPGRQVLLLFLKGASTASNALPGGVIPGHDGAGRSHLAFAVDASELDAWRSWLETHQAPIEGEMNWPRGGTSLYFRDPDGHLLELATPGVWPIY